LYFWFENKPSGNPGSEEEALEIWKARFCKKNELKRYCAIISEKKNNFGQL
jgi:hypothetical protein